MATRKLGRIIAVVGVATLALAACGSDDSTSSDSDATTAPGTSDGLSVSDAWARSTPEDAVRAAVYLTVESDESDEIVAASVPGDIAAMAELHETVAGGTGDMNHDDGMDGDGMDDDGMDDDGMDDDGMDGMDGMDDDGMDHDDGATTMRAVEAVPVAAGTTTLEPGGYHIMLMELVKPLTEGETFELTLEFENEGSKNVTVTVRAA